MEGGASRAAGSHFDRVIKKNTMKFEGLQLSAQGRKVHRAKSIGPGVKAAERVFLLCDGPFANFNGTVDEVMPEKGKVRVLVSILGRSTPVELDFVQVNRL